ncbi:hypothetical protein AK830_g235 [Neonectria ditissima]|uniref:Uncharacterized protein n=1 Tax=Neonectria ditissima TaxID=78410 RepID=A0A0P7C3Q7_9HYPO|nr:hypothetical protein AK830_g235 [Neonectria ditissima]
MSAPSRSTAASTLPQGFSVYQPALGAQLQFLPAVGTPQLDELLGAYIPGPASAQEKRASVSLDFLEYSHLTGQSFKFYPVYAMTAESPVTASPLQDSASGSSFNASPVISNWDWSRASNGSRSPTSQQARTSPKAASSRHQAADFSHIPGMKIMTKDGLDVTNSASRGSKTKEQRDHAHLMRIIKACDSCKRKKIRCDPSHKKRGAAQAVSQSQAAAKVTKKVKAVAQEVRAVAPAVVPQTDFSASASSFAIDQSFAPMDMETLTPALSGLEPWEEFIQYPSADLPDDYDFFYDPQGYLSPLSSSSLSACSTKPVTPTSTSSQQDLSGSYNLSTGEVSVPSPHLPFDQTDSIHDYVDFNLFSPQSSFSEDDQMVPIELSRQAMTQSRSLQSELLRPDQSSGGSGVQLGDVSGATMLSASQDLSRSEVQSPRGPYRDPGLDTQDHYSPSSSSLNSDLFGSSMSWIEETVLESAQGTTYVTNNGPDGCQSDGDNVALRNSDNATEALLAERVSILATVRQPAGPDASTMTRAGLAATAVDRVCFSDFLLPEPWLTLLKAASTDGSLSSRAIAHGELQSLANVYGDPSTRTNTMATNVAVATNPAFLSAMDTPVAVYGSGDLSDGLQVTSVDASSTALRTVAAHREQSSVSRGTGAYATIIAGDLDAATIASGQTSSQSLIQQRIVDASEMNSEALTPYSGTDAGVREVSSRVSTEVVTQTSVADSAGVENAPRVDNTLHVDNALRVENSPAGENAPRVETALIVETKTKNYYAETYAKTRSAVGEGFSLSPLTATAALVMASGSSMSSTETHLRTMLAIVLLFVAMANWSHVSSKASLWSSKGTSKTERTQHSGRPNDLCGRLKSLESQASRGVKQLGRVISRSAALMSV